MDLTIHHHRARPAQIVDCIIQVDKSHRGIRGRLALGLDIRARRSGDDRENEPHERHTLQSISGRLPTLPGKNANANEQAKLNIWLVAVISVVSSCAVIPAELSMLPR